MRIVLFVVFLRAAYCLETVVFSTGLGDVEGNVYNVNGRDIAGFYGVPYAKPPVGELRFQPPQPVDPWSSTLNCTELPPSCWYREVPFREYLLNPPMSEDCLYLNIWTPVDTNNKPLPVLFYIHGGGFSTDTAAHFGDETVARILPPQDVVVVVLNYRLGVLGFLTTGSHEAKGNQGLWDVKQALDWTKEHISSFNGDPDRITVGGQSAGSMITQLMLMSNHTQHSFAKGIMTSGSVAHPFELKQPQEVYESLFAYAQFLGFNGTTEQRQEFLDFFRTVEPQDLALDGTYSPDNAYEGSLTAWPVLDDDFISADWEAALDGIADKPMIVSLVRDEGVVVLSGDGIETDARSQIQSTFFASNANTTDVDIVFNTFVTSDDPDERKQQALDVVSDLILNNGVYQFITEITGRCRSPVFVYRFDYYRDRPVNETYPRPIKGATHCDDLPYLFGQDVNRPYNATPDDLVITKQLSGYVANFVKSGNPNKHRHGGIWKKVVPSGDVHNLIIDLPGTRRNNDLFNGRYKTWRRLARQFDLELYK